MTKGTCSRCPTSGGTRSTARHPVFEDQEWYYFVHSYCVAPADNGLVAATADYGGRFCAAIARDNVLACQFHPEKSQHAGARVIGHFLGDISWS